MGETLTNLYNNSKINIKPWLTISHPVISSLLLYGLYSFSISKTCISKLQRCYSRCTREIQYGTTLYDPNTNRMTNKQIRINNNITTAQRNLNYVKINTSHRWYRTQSIAYLNDNVNIDNRLQDYYKN